MLKPVKLTIRQLMEREESLLLEYAPLFADEVHLDNFDKHAFVEWLIDEISRGLAVCYVAVDCEQRVVGAIAGRIEHDQFSGSNQVQQAFWYVVNEYRGTDISVQLDSALADWGRDRGATQMLSGHFYNGNTNMSRFFRMLGYRPWHITHIKEL